MKIARVQRTSRCGSDEEWLPERSAHWRVSASTASARASSGSMPRSSMFSRTMASKASCEIAIAISLLCLWAWVPLLNGTALLGVSPLLRAILNFEWFPSFVLAIYLPKWH